MSMSIPSRVRYEYEAGKLYGRFEVLCQCTEHGHGGGAQHCFKMLFYIPFQKKKYSSTSETSHFL